MLLVVRLANVITHSGHFEIEFGSSADVVLQVFTVLLREITKFAGHNVVKVLEVGCFMACRRWTRLISTTGLLLFRLALIHKWIYRAIQVFVLQRPSLPSLNHPSLMRLHVF